MSGLASRRRLWVLVAVAVVTAVVLWHAGSPHHAVPSAARGLFRQRGSDAHSLYAAHLAHPSEADALPLVSAVASFSVVASSGERAHVAVCAVPTHEEQYLPEWLTWHRLVGVERFYLFDNQPSTRMRRLLRPWIDEGTVVLYELEYEDGVDIGAVYQNHVLRLCERDVLPVTSWVSHHDVDEFLMVDAPGWSPTLPSLVNTSLPAADPSSPLVHDATDAEDRSAGEALAPSQRWTYPLHARFDSLLSEATCVPMLRLPFQNYGVRTLEPTDFVTERQTVKDRVPPNFHTYGKMFIHPKEGSLNAGWLGPHSCRATSGGAVMDAQGMELLFESTTYPYAGAPLPQEGIMLYHYIQRSLADCRAKYHVLSSTPQDWRTRDGLAGCARNYVPLDAELATPDARAQLVADDPEHGDELAARPESWGVLFTRDTSARDSWQGRMTRAILGEWRARGGKEAQEQGRWWWEMGDEASDERLEGMMSGIVSVESVGRGIPPKVRLEAVVPQ
ncbi:glycosyltransferase family 2 protein [Rhodotorula paludigena]|uniref:glycosyltransferase family 2 protein n=1 Tax=Rhodotorula paludigena TaxID=86838 RepID=UPI00317283F5